MKVEARHKASKDKNQDLRDLIFGVFDYLPATPEIVVLHKAREVTRMRLDRSPIKVGRKSDNDVVLKDRAVSRHHAIIVSESDRWWIRDAGSRHKLWFAGQQCETHALKHGDQVDIHPFTLLFRGSSL